MNGWYDEDQEEAHLDASSDADDLDLIEMQEIYPSPYASHEPNIKWSFGGEEEQGDNVWREDQLDNNPWYDEATEERGRDRYQSREDVTPAEMIESNDSSGSMGLISSLLAHYGRDKPSLLVTDSFDPTPTDLITRKPTLSDRIQARWKRAKESEAAEIAIEAFQEWWLTVGRTAFYAVLWLGLQLWPFLTSFAKVSGSSPQFETARFLMGRYSLGAARGAAAAIHWNMVFIYLTMCKGLWTFVRSPACLGRWRLATWIPLDALGTLHIWIGLSIAFWSVVHIIAHGFNLVHLAHRRGYDKTGETGAALFLWLFGTGAGLTGVLITITLLAILIFSLPTVRRQCFEYFYYVHHLFTLFTIGLVLHGAFCFIKTDTLSFPQPPNMNADIKGCAGPNSYLYILPGLCIYLVERIWREGIRAYFSTVLSRVILHPSAVLELQFKKPGMGRVLPGQYVRLMVPKLGRLQWHPFTLTSAPEEGFLSVHIRLVGDWTRRLASLFDIPLDSKGLPIYQNAPPNASPRSQGDPPMSIRHVLGTPLPNQAQRRRSPDASMSHLIFAEASSISHPAPADQPAGWIVLMASATQAARTPSVAYSMDLRSRHASHDRNHSVTPPQPQLLPPMPLKLPKIYIDGPFGTAAEELFHFDVAICVGAGIGQTPFASLLKSIWYRVLAEHGSPHAASGTGDSAQRALGRLQKCYFFGICRDATAFEWFHDVLAALEDEQASLNLAFLTFCLFLTGPLKPDQVQNVMIHDAAGACDAITGLRSPTLFGRPHFLTLFDTIKDQHHPLRRVGEDSHDLQQRLIRAHSGRSKRSGCAWTGSATGERATHRWLRWMRPRAASPASIHPARASSSQSLPKQTVKVKAPSKTLRIGVFYCGPKAMDKALAKACFALSDQHVQFVFKKENF